MNIIYELLIPETNVTPFVLGRLNFVCAVRLSKYLKNPPSCICYMVDKNLRWMIDMTAWLESGQEIVKSLEENPNKYSDFNKKLRADCLVLKKFGKELFFTDLDGKSNDDLWDLYNQGISLYEEVYERGMIPTIADLGEPFLTTMLKQLLEKYTDDIEHSFVVLTTPTEPSDFLNEELELLQFIEADDLTVENLEKHYKKYFWTIFGYEGPEYTIEKIKQRIEELKKEGKIEEKIKELKSYEKTTQSKLSSLESDLKLDNKVKEMFDIAREWLFLKGLRKEAFFSCYSGMDKLALELAKRFGLSKDEVKFLTKEELNKAVYQNELPKNLPIRVKESLYLCSPDGVDQVLVGDDLKNFLSASVKQSSQDQKVTEINGQIACLGYAKGKVKLIYQPSDMDKMAEGDILVSPATNPNLLPAMRIASAFVTDLGGITCHAAIVAREMKKPCIIGTKIATKVLHDGDLVEVDANQGVIKIIQ